ncbi:hypothetical protein [Polaromonas sp. YR568]|uniref:hypothetical protein n=1 Tax=Polaromonas sp. YR568 TaxID=1855301 RepID=UPI0031379145
MATSTRQTLLPRKFCWTKFGAEAGESFDEIFARKEKERQANHGIFLWGVGNSVAPGLRILVKTEVRPSVIFSPMRSPAKAIDISPPAVVEWMRAVGLGGQEWDIPNGSIVTSRAGSLASGTKKKHYALVCHSDKPLGHVVSPMEVDLDNLRNLSSGGELGFSQVTSVVQTLDTKSSSSRLKYPVGFVAELVYPYFLELTEPVLVTPGAGRAKQRAKTLQPELDLLKK